MLIGVYNEKGGSGKTTVSVHIALTLGWPLVDLDEQQTAKLWLANRTPAASVYDDAADLPNAILDFGPGRDLAKAKILGKMDLIVIPVRPTFNDLATVGNAVRVARSLKRPAGFVVTMLNPRTTEAREVGEALAPYGLPLLGTTTHRVSYSRAGLSGNTAAELGDEVAKTEISMICKRIVGWQNSNA